MKFGLLGLALSLGVTTAATAEPAAPPAPPPPGTPGSPDAAAPRAPANAAPNPSKTKTVDAITVTGGRSQDQVALDKRSYSLAKDLQATSGSIADALRNIPSVEVDGQGTLSIRGDSNVTILVDGKPSPTFEGKGRSDALQQLPADQIERVEVITNPSAALNPEGSAGVINLVTKTSRGAGISGSSYLTAGSGGLKRTGITFGYNSQRLAVTAALSAASLTNKVHATDVRGGIDKATEQFLGNSDIASSSNLNRSESGRLTAAYDLAAKDRVSATATFNDSLIHGHLLDRFEDDNAAGLPVSILNDAGERRFLESDSGLSGQWKHNFTADHALTLDLIYNTSLVRDRTLNAYNNQLVAPAAPFEAIRDDQSQHHKEIRLVDTQSPAGGALKLGYELKVDDNDYDFTDQAGVTPGGLTPLANRANHFLFSQTINAGYATFQHGYGKADLQAGLRVEDTHLDLAQLTSGRRDSQRYTKFFPSLQLGYKLDDDRLITASYSVRLQRPTASLLNPLVYVLDPKDQRQGNPGLKPKEIQAFEVAFDGRQGKTTLTATAYYRITRHDFTDVIADLGGGVFNDTYLNIGSRQAAGLDLTASSTLTTALSYSGTVSLYWNQLHTGGLGVPTGPETLYGASGRANLNWQATAGDLIQVNGIVNGRRLIPQGTLLPTFTLNLGWRHKLTDRVTATVTAQDLLAGTGYHRRIDTAELVERYDVRPAARAIVLRLDFRFGHPTKGNKEPAFDYGDTPG